MKKLFLIFFIFFSSFFIIFSSWYATNTPPSIVCEWLPGCISTGDGKPVVPKKTLIIEFLAAWAWVLIKYVAVIAVISLMWGGVLYMLSWGKEDKMKKAKAWIIWSLVWVFFSVSAWFIINVINAFKIP